MPNKSIPTTALILSNASYTLNSDSEKSEEDMKSLEEIKRLIQKHKDEVRNKYGVKEIGIFGSYVQGTQKGKSDIDILIELDEGGETFDNYMELKFFLEDLLKAKVDLVIRSTVREEIKEDILSETVYV